LDRRIVDSGLCDQKHPYPPAPNPRVQELSAIHAGLFITWRMYDGKIGKQGLADKAGREMSEVYREIMAIA
jgi:hypothetical protein